MLTCVIISLLYKSNCMQFICQNSYVFDMFTNHSWCRKYGLDDNTVDFIGHALALYKDDSYLEQPAIDFVQKVKVDYLKSSSHFVLFKFLLCYSEYWLDKAFTYNKYLLFEKDVCRVLGSISRRITLHLSFVWARRIAAGKRFRC